MAPASRSYHHARSAGAAALLLLTGVLPVCLAQAELGPFLSPPTTAPATTPATNPAPAGFARVHGIVLDPAGKPVAKARVAVVVSRPSTNLPPPDPLAETRTFIDGRFDLTFRKPDARATQDSRNFGGALVPAGVVIPSRADLATEAGQAPLVVASADGSGPAWERSDRTGDLTLRLVPDRRIEGRIFDLEGRPVAGVEVTPHAIMPYDASAPQAANRGSAPDDRGATLYYPPASTGVAATTTDAEGRFRIDGTGADRTVVLQFDSARVVLAPVQVITRTQVPPVRTAFANGRVFVGQQYYGVKPELFAAPARAVVGTVRDADTHRPVAGVKVASAFSTGARREAVTDEQGQFRLAGLAKGQFRLQVTPPADQPYFVHERQVPDQPGIAALHVDIDLHPGVWISGRVTDKGTGEPVPAFVQYAPLLSNKHAAIPEYQAVQGLRYFQGPQGSGTTADDGSFRVVGLPGAGLVAVVTRDELYPKGQGADQIKDTLPAPPDPAAVVLQRPGTPRKIFATYQPWMAPDRVTAVKAVELPDKSAEAAPAQLDFRLDAGNAIEIAMSDANGNALTGAWVVGDHADSAPSRIQATAFKAVDFGDDEKRLLVLRDVDGALGKVIAVRLADAPRRRLSVRLEPRPTVTGRVVDADGKPVASASVRVETAMDGMTDRQQRRIATAKTQEDGRFQIDVYVGCDYSLTVEAGGTAKGAVGRFGVEPGGKKDLGDVRLGNVSAP